MSAKGTISRDVAFRALAKVRKDKAAASCGWAVYNVKKDGSLYRHPTSLHASQELAEGQARYLRSLNPGSAFQVVDLAKPVEKALRTYRVTVGQALRYSVRNILQGVGEITNEGYSGGSTSWTYELETELTPEQIQSAVWNVFNSICVEVW